MMGTVEDRECLVPDSAVTKPLHLAKYFEVLFVRLPFPLAKNCSFFFFNRWKIGKEMKIDEKKTFEAKAPETKTGRVLMRNSFLDS